MKTFAVGLSIVAGGGDGGGLGAIVLATEPPLDPPAFAEGGTPASPAPLLRCPPAEVLLGGGGPLSSFPPAVEGPGPPLPSTFPPPRGFFPPLAPFPPFLFTLPDASPPSAGAVDPPAAAIRFSSSAHQRINSASSTAARRSASSSCCICMSVLEGTTATCESLFCCCWMWAKEETAWGDGRTTGGEMEKVGVAHAGSLRTEREMRGLGQRAY